MLNSALHRSEAARRLRNKQAIRMCKEEDSGRRKLHSQAGLCRGRPLPCWGSIAILSSELPAVKLAREALQKNEP
eukprot:scaffold657_cov245-Pinguiococcus_pyrenoidosus.AAC.13